MTSQAVSAPVSDDSAFLNCDLNRFPVSYGFPWAYCAPGQLLPLLRRQHNLVGSLEGSECGSQMLCVQKTHGFRGLNDTMGLSEDESD